MPSLRLTDPRIKALKPTQTTRDFRDKDMKGYSIRIMSSGRRQLFIHTQCNGRRIWKIIGDPDLMNLADARQAAQCALAAIRKGQPVVASPGETLFELVAEEVFSHNSHHWKPSTLDVNRYYFHNQILPWFEERQ